jgi:hypothetical protein
MHDRTITSHTICQRLGLAGFDSDSGLLDADEAIRVLLMPAFHAEVCFSLLRHGEQVEASVRSSRGPLRDSPRQVRLQADRERLQWSTEEFRRLAARVAELARSFQPSERGLDGMRVDMALWRRGAPVARIASKLVSSGALDALVGDLVEPAWKQLENPWCRVAVAAAGRYVGLVLRERQWPHDRDLALAVFAARVGPKKDERG